MEKLIEDINHYIKEHNIEMSSSFFSRVEASFEMIELLFNMTNEIIDDPDSMYNNMTDEIETLLITNRDNYLKSLQVINNIHKDIDSEMVLKDYHFYYQISESVFLKKGFSKGLAHFFSLCISKDILVDKANEMASQLTIDILASFSDIELESLKLKNKLLFSLIELTTNKKFSSIRNDKFIESIELSKKIKSLNDNPTTNPSNSNYIDTSKKDNKFETLKSNLYNSGFYELSKVKSLSQDSQSKLIDLLILNETPYNVAMFEFLGYFKYLTNELGYTNTKIHTKLSAFFDVDEQTFKCNMLVLNEKSKLRENIRYTSYKHKEKVKTDYNSLK